MTTLFDAVTAGVGEVISWVGSVVTALVTDTGSLNALLPLFAVGIGVSAVMLAIKVIRGFIWGA